ncbi:sugar transferase [Pseudomonadota bacterium]|nr:sugar transferase [Pseudomonadota bacterium]
MKRYFDIILSILCIIILFFPFLCIFIIIKLDTPGPAIFYSKRFGKNKNFFLMPKFRSMKTNTPQLATNLLNESEKYVTKIGSFLRKTSLDEIPQLWSILIGDMSFVGPRPALFNQFDLMTLREKFDIHLSTPGLTGWAQVNGRDEVSIHEKVSIERFYEDNKSFILDLKILYLTFLKVIKMKDIKH